jgi:hypothetical protein
MVRCAGFDRNYSGSAMRSRESSPGNPGWSLCVEIGRSGGSCKSLEPLTRAISLRLTMEGQSGDAGGNMFDG